MQRINKPDTRSAASCQDSGIAILAMHVGVVIEQRFKQHVNLAGYEQSCRLRLVSSEAPSKKQISSFQQPSCKQTSSALAVE